MATTFKTATALLTAALALTVLASCGRDRAAPSTPSNAQGVAFSDTALPIPLIPDNFKGVCSGAPVSSATAYDPGAKTHKALYFATYKDDLMDRSSTLPADWTVRFSVKEDALKAIDLVVCARRTTARAVKVCDGFKKDGKPIDNKVRWHTATYELSVKEARTGKTLAHKTVEATDSDCPMFQMFDGDSETIDGYATLSNPVVADFLKPYIAR